MSSKGQMSVNQIFTFIITAVVIGMIFLFGWFAFAKLNAASEQAMFSNFVNEIKTSISKGSDYGSVKLETFTIGGNYKKVCFVDVDVTTRTGGVCDSGSSSYNAIICNSWKSGSRQTVYTIPMNENTIETESIAVHSSNADIDRSDVGYIGSHCFDVKNSKINLKLWGKGDHTLITPQ